MVEVFLCVMLGIGGPAVSVGTGYGNNEGVFNHLFLFMDFMEKIVKDCSGRKSKSFSN